MQGLKHIAPCTITYNQVWSTKLIDTYHSQTVRSHFENRERRVRGVFRAHFCFPGLKAQRLIFLYRKHLCAYMWCRKPKSPNTSTVSQISGGTLLPNDIYALILRYEKATEN